MLSDGPRDRLGDDRVLRRRRQHQVGGDACLEVDVLARPAAGQSRRRSRCGRPPTVASRRRTSPRTPRPQRPVRSRVAVLVERARAARPPASARWPRRGRRSASSCTPRHRRTPAQAARSWPSGRSLRPVDVEQVAARQHPRSPARRGRGRSTPPGSAPPHTHGPTDLARRAAWPAPCPCCPPDHDHREVAAFVREDQHQVAVVGARRRRRAGHRPELGARSQPVDAVDVGDAARAPEPLALTQPRRSTDPSVPRRPPRDRPPAATPSTRSPAARPSVDHHLIDVSLPDRQACLGFAPHLATARSKVSRFERTPASEVAVGSDHAVQPPAPATRRTPPAASFCRTCTETWSGTHGRGGTASLHAAARCPLAVGPGRGRRGSPRDRGAPSPSRAPAPSAPPRSSPPAHRRFCPRHDCLTRGFRPTVSGWS